MTELFYGGSMKTFLFCILFSAVAFGCNKSLDVENVPFYPAVSGNIWMYSGMDTVVNFRPIYPGVHFRDTSTHWVTRIDSLTNVILHDSVPTLSFRSTDTFDSLNQFIGHHYYITKNDSMFLFAYDGGSGVLPKKSSHYHFTVRGILFTSLEDIHRYVRGMELSPQATVSIVYEERPPKVMVFPLHVGTEWTFRERGYPSFFIGKKITGTESISTPAGELATYKIQWSWDFDNNGVADTDIQAFDYVTKNGLMKRTIILKNAVITEDDPTPLAYVDIEETYIITSFTISDAELLKRIAL